MQRLFAVVLSVLLSSTLSYGEQVKEESKSKESTPPVTTTANKTADKEVPSKEKTEKRIENKTKEETPKADKQPQSSAASAASGKSGYGGNTQAVTVNVEPFTGGANFAFPISVPPGRGGIQPQVSINYNSGNHQLGLAGVGWSLELGSIQRSTKKGTPTYDDTKDTFILNLGGSIELVKDPTTNRYYPKTEGAFNKIEKIANYWRIVDKKGTEYYFGKESYSRQNNPNIANAVAKWYLDAVIDVNGNAMRYVYSASDNYLYPSLIEYGRSIGTISTTEIPYYAQVKFEYKDAAYKTSSYLFGFKIFQSKILQSITTLVRTNGDTAFVRQNKYVFDYTMSADTYRDLLTQVTNFGLTDADKLPSVKLTYSNVGIYGDNRYVYDPALVQSFSMLGNGSTLLDINSDGYADIVKSSNNCDSNEYPLAVYINNKQNSWDLNSSIFRQGVPGFAQVCAGDTDSGVRFADVNEDNLIDIVQASEQNGIVKSQIFLNSSNDFKLTADIKLPSDLRINKAYGVTFNDVDGDGLTDFVTDNGAYFNFYLKSNLKKPNEFVLSNRFGLSRVGDLKKSTFVVDLNGDGLADVINLNAGQVNLYWNAGGAFVTETNLNKLPFKDWIDIGRVATIADLNGDGLPEIITNTPSESKFFINTGDGWRENANWAINGLNLANGCSQFTDVNGDGLSDVIYDACEPRSIIYLSPGRDVKNAINVNEFSGPSDVLVGIDNGIGAKTEIIYDHANKPEYENKFLPFPLQVVKEIRVKNTPASPVAFNYVTKYAYKIGIWDPKEREFLGFNEVRVIDADGNYALTNFLQDTYRKGQPYRQMSFDAKGKILNRVDTYWKLVDTNKALSKFSYAQRNDQYVYNDKGEYKRTAQVAVVDTTNGNLSKTINYGEISQDSPEMLLRNGDYVPEFDPLAVVDVGTDYSVQEMMYAQNLNKWLIGLPMRKMIQDKAGKTAFLEWYYYDGSPYYNSQPSKGMLTMRHGWDGGTPAIAVYTKYSYDLFGNLETTTDPRNYTTRITYDSSYKLFPVTVENALLQKSYTTYYGVNEAPTDDARLKGLWGQTKSTKDINNQQSWVNYDNFGRATFSVGPLDSVDFPAATTAYTVQGAYTQVTQKVRIENNKAPTIDTSSFYDGLGRLIQSKSPSATAGQWIVSGQTVYNNRGLIDKQYVPRFTTKGLNTLDPIDATSVYEQYKYDALGRTISVIHKDGSYSTTIYGLWYVTTVDENGHAQVNYLDSAGRLARKEEVIGADGRSKHYPFKAYEWYARTLYEYDTLGNLIKVTDAQNNVTTIKYDALGRKKSMDDPDMGHWEYGYDLNGNLTSQKDNKGQILNFVYDELNRLKNKNEIPVSPAVVGPPIEPVNVNYQYDDKNQLYGLGRLNKASYNNDFALFKYDQLGREKSSIKTIDNTQYGVVRTYDALNRLTDLKFPNNNKIYYTYNLAGQINGILTKPPTDPQPLDKAYVKDIKYNVFGQMTEITYGNGVVTNYEFDALTQRLKQVVTLDAKGALIQFFDYTYDSIGQVKSITDSVNTATQIFSYDSLNRLIEANGTNYGLKKYSYDMIGNILTKDGLTYTYGKVADKTGPHAVQSLSDGTVYKYDPNGNMISKTKGSNQTEYVYDAENRLRYAYSRKVGEARRYLISNYTYDGDGGRVKKIVYRRATLPNVDPLTAMMLGDNYAKMQESIRNQLAQAITTVYVGNLSESEAGRVTNFIYLGSQKIASVSGTDVFYYHTDHLGGLNVLTDRFGLARELTEIDPFGQTVKHQKFGAPSKTAWYYFTGKPFDDETGLYYYGARYYDPKLGRFITPDTVVQRHNDPQTLNRYSYCSNNPVNRVDMDGHKWSWRKFFGAIVGAVVTAVVTIVLTPFVGPVFAGAIGGALGGMVSAGISGGNIGQAALFGAIGGAIGGGLGAASKWSSGWGAAARFTSDGLALASVASAGMSDSWDGLAGGFLGSYLGNKFANSEQFKNWQSGRGFKSNADIQKEVMAKIRASANGDGGLGWDDVAVTTNDKGAVEWWLKESAVPGPFGQPVSEWQNGKPTEWGNLMKYTDAAGGAWSTAENTAVYGGLVVATLATAGGAAEMAGVLNTAPQSNNIIRIMSRPGRWGYRIDKPDAHKPYIHDHFWRW